MVPIAGNTEPTKNRTIVTTIIGLTRGAKTKFVNGLIRDILPKYRNIRGTVNTCAENPNNAWFLIVPIMLRTIAIFVFVF